MLSKVVSQSDEISIEKKKRFMANTADIILENTVVNGIDEKAYNDAKDFFTTSFDVLTDDEETFSILEMLAAHGDHLYAHCLGVSIYSVLIARNMDWRSTANLFKLSFGALMHDIGKKEFPSELIDKPRTKLTYDERKLLETHSFRSKEILETLKSAPQEVVEIAFQHHENILGQGFPRQISKNRIHPMAKIVSVADNFCNYAMKGPNTPGVNAKKAIHLIDTYKQDQLDPDCIKALKASVK